jgi:hypothetical protein
MFRRAHYSPHEQQEAEKHIQQTERELAELERHFLERIAESNLKLFPKCNCFILILTVHNYLSSIHS